jgi:DNA replicative helicase MCM subunit Mcm2 (Cdc46/Mcm family)
MLSLDSSSPMPSTEDDNDNDHSPSGSSIIGRQRGTSNTNEKKGLEGGPTPKDLSISQAKRETSGYVKIKGTIVSLSPVYHMIKAVVLTCNVCGKSSIEEYPIPKYKVSSNGKSKCPHCTKGGGGGRQSLS